MKQPNPALSKPHKNPSKRRLEGFRKWEDDSPRLDREQGLGAALSRLVEQLGVGERLSEQRAVELWAEVVGDQIAKISKAVGIRDGILTLEVLNPSWRHELSYMAPDILAKLNQRLGSKLVIKLKFG